MQRRIAIIAVAAAALIAAACADQDGGRQFSTEPTDTSPVVRYVTSGVPAITDPKTHRPVDVTSEAWRGGVSASVVAASVVDDGLQVASGDPGVAPTAGRTIWSFTDAAKHVQKIVLLYRDGGGPPAAMQHYTDGALVSTTAYTWGKTQAGWVRTRSYMQSVRNGSLVGTFTTTSTPAKPGTGGPIETVRLQRSRHAARKVVLRGLLRRALHNGVHPLIGGTMRRPADNRLMKNGLMWVAIVVSLALLTPWGVAHRHSLQPRFALVAVVCGTLSGAAFLVNGVVTIFSRHGGWKAAALPFCFAISCFLLAVTFLLAENDPAAQNYTLAGAALFMITAAVLQQRARERPDSL
jgi:hypothetical protein